MFNFNRVLTNIELQKEKFKDYRNVVFSQAIIIIMGLTLVEYLDQGREDQTAKLVISIFTFFGVIYAFLLWDMMRNFTGNQYLIRGVLLLLCGIVIAGILVEFPYYQVIEIENKRIYLMVIHSILLAIEVLVITFAVIDVFTGDYLTSDKLWGAACVYLMTAISFASIYDLICIIRPGSLGEDIELGLPSYAECVYYSMNVLGGLDSAYPDATKLIRNIGVIEAVWGSLFGVLIIGKLLVLPRKDTFLKNKEMKDNQKEL